ncbi:SprT-like family-domain-containing protein [Ampelomyces quisqualis]|uniref:Protein with SprT-like domain at the N terminus n=1 Tax=Ampelomyces quisqualis TaxID=50730 RepID=A0A6A5QI26_AMPQU|nr:SprT-like family-domain-containing protein [Ampelomyces quisqualis]
MLTDEAAALQAIATLENLSTDQLAALRAINTIIHNGEPFVDVHELVAHYNVLYFRALLLPRVEVLWSPRLTLCAGICELSKDPTTGKSTRIRLKLSTPLLQYRPRCDTINTLIHEAIHAYFFITTSWRHSRGHDGTGHGLGFQLLAEAINNHGNYQVTIYHTFHDEVDSYRTHIWQCDGPCQTQPPYFGLVKRSMNRAPGKSDTWWARHESQCGGTYTKIQAPTLTTKQLNAMSAKERAGRQNNKLDGWVTASANPTRAKGDAAAQPIDVDAQHTPSSKTAKLKRKSSTLALHDLGEEDLQGKRSRQGRDNHSLIVGNESLVQCPICNQGIPEIKINQHLDDHLS